MKSGSPAGGAKQNKTGGREDAPLPENDGNVAAPKKGPRKRWKGAQCDDGDRRRRREMKGLTKKSSQVQGHRPERGL